MAKVTARQHDQRKHCEITDALQRAYDCPAYIQ